MPHTLGPIWRDANVRSGPSLDSHIQRHLLPGDGTSYQAVDWVKGDEVVEGENPNGEIVSDIWFQLHPRRLVQRRELRAGHHRPGPRAGQRHGLTPAPTHVPPAPPPCAGGMPAARRVVADTGRERSRQAGQQGAAALVPSTTAMPSKGSDMVGPVDALRRLGVLLPAQRLASEGRPVLGTLALLAAPAATQP